MLNKGVKAGAALVLGLALVSGTALPALAGTQASKACYDSGGANVGTMYGYLYTDLVQTKELFGECGTVYVQGRYYAYIGGPSYLSPWYSSPTSANYSHTNMYHGWHKTSYAPAGTKETWFS